MENVIDISSADLPFLTETDEPQNETDVPRERAKVPTRAGTRAVMFITALCGAGAGVALAVSGAADEKAVLALLASGTFGDIFFRRAIIGAAFLLFEFLLGFFAFGDFISWAAPTLAGMGAGFFVTALEKPIFIPSEAAILLALIFSGANSAAFSQKLFGLARGNHSFMRGMTAAEYAARFAIALPIVVGAAALEGIAATAL